MYFKGNSIIVSNEQDEKGVKYSPDATRKPYNCRRKSDIYDWKVEDDKTKLNTLDKG